MGTEYLIIILLWCGQPNSRKWDFEVDMCRRNKIACVAKLKNFTTDDVINKCLIGTK